MAEGSLKGDLSINAPLKEPFSPPFKKSLKNVYSTLIAIFTIDH